MRHQLKLGSHDLFLAEIVAAHYDEEVLDSRGRLRPREVHPVTLVESEYWSLGERVGLYGGGRRAAGRTRARARAKAETRRRAQ